jgi:hypothetical protein
MARKNDERGWRKRRRKRTVFPVALVEEAFSPKEMKEELP